MTTVRLYGRDYTPCGRCGQPCRPHLLKPCPCGKRLCSPCRRTKIHRTHATKLPFPSGKGPGVR